MCDRSGLTLCGAISVTPKRSDESAANGPDGEEVYLLELTEWAFHSASDRNRFGNARQRVTPVKEE